MYKYHLNDVEWRGFFISEIFSFTERGRRLKIDDRENGNSPFVTAGESDNGISSFICNIKQKSYNKAITIDMFGNAFFQKGCFKCDDNITVLQNDLFSDSIYIFLTSRLNILNEKYSYGKQLRPNRLFRDKIMLPTKEDGNPNWNFMEEYIKEREKKQRNDLKEYYKSRLLDLVVCPEVLTDVEWDEFFLGDVFIIDTKPSRGLNHLNRDEKKGVSYIGATNRNNGVLDFVEGDSKMQYKGNCIAFIRNGEGSMGYSIYKKESFIATQDISVGYNEKLNEYSAKFITTIADRVRGKYTFGYKRNQARLKKEILTLPIDENGEPNWTYMENFIKNIEQKQVKNILKYLDKYIYIYIMYNYFDKVDWKEFFLSDICNINSGVRLTKANMQDGNIPFIGATDSNNGITNFVSNTNASYDKNVIGVNYNGSVVENFYHPYSCVFSDDVKRVSFKDEQGQNKYCYMFLKQMILQQKEKYRYAYKFNGDRMARQKIMMPVDCYAKINFNFMKRYITSKELKRIIDIIKAI